ncbi:hypothetical protein [Mesoplasma seiffertii]|uniref:hypothetical protein n=1 Tax=Mesoplasma seiffertii TaxID=28224 RepID=UPI00047D94FB|nr:hypothetical protein [Mesoplasma seiffertii]
MEQKQKFSLKKRLNFKINDQNEDLKRRNIRLYLMSFWFAFIFLVTLLPFYVYVYITFNNDALTYYFEHYQVISQFIDVPSKATIMGTLSGSLLLTFLVIGMFILFKPIMTSRAIRKNSKLAYLTAIVGVGMLVLLLAALSQYFYAAYQDFYIYESKTGSEGKHAAMAEISDWYSNRAGKGEFVPNFMWQTSDIVWWIMFLQIMILFSIGIALQNMAFGNAKSAGIDRYVKWISKNKKITGSKFKTLWNRLFRIDDKTLSLWTIVITLTIILPQIIYIILSSASTTGMGSIVNWTYNVVNLVGDYEAAHRINELFDSAFKSYQLNPLFITSLPLIALGITISSMFFFVSVSIKGENVSNRIFITQYIVLFFELILLLCLTTYSKAEINRTTNLWNQIYASGDQTIGITLLNEIKNVVTNNGESMYDWEQLIEMYPLNGIDEANGTFVWLGKYGIIAEAIIVYSFMFSSFGILSNGIWKSAEFKSYLKKQFVAKRIARLEEIRKGDNDA